MEQITIPAGGKYTTSINNRYLYVARSSGVFVIRNPQLGTHLGEQGTHFELGDLDVVTLENINSDAIDVLLVGVDSPAKSGVVAVSNKLTIERIEGALPVVATAVVDGGTVSQIVPDTITTLNDVTIAPGDVAMLLPSRPAYNRSVTLQVIAPQWAAVRIGESSAIQAHQGLYLRGNAHSPATTTITTTAALFARNTSDVDAILAIMEVYSSAS